MEGGPSHVDLFDPKPELTRLHGKPLPASFGKVITPMGTGGNNAARQQAEVREARQVRPRLLRLAAAHGDVRRRLRRAPRLPGRRAEPRRQRLPDEHRLDPRGPAVARLVGALRPRHARTRTCPASSSSPRAAASRSAARGTGAPATCPRPTRARSSAAAPSPILNLEHARRTSAPTARRRKLDLIAQAERHPPPRAARRLAARRAAGRLRTRLPMQATAPEAVDLSQETGEDEGSSTASTARRPPSSARAACSPAGWSSAACASCRSTAAPAASGTPTPTSRATTPKHVPRPTSRPRRCINDLKRRGLLDDTLVIWGGEFGRTPMSEGTNGRDHNPYGFTMLHGRRRREGRARPRHDRRVRPATASRAASTSTTSTPPSCTCSASTTRSSPSATTAATTA